MIAHFYIMCCVSRCGFFLRNLIVSFKSVKDNTATHLDCNSYGECQVCFPKFLINSFVDRTKLRGRSLAAGQTGERCFFPRPRRDFAIFSASSNDRSMNGLRPTTMGGGSPPLNGLLGLTGSALQVHQNCVIAQYPIKH